MPTGNDRLLNVFPIYVGEPVTAATAVFDPAAARTDNGTDTELQHPLPMSILACPSCAIS